MSISSDNEEHNTSNNINNNNNNNEESNRPACAACKHQRKKCKKGCSFLLHFPASRHQEFSAVHRIFGIANVNKMMKGTDLEKQGEVVESIIWEAMVWTNKDHKERGPYGLYRRLEEDCKRLEEENRRLKEQLLKSQQEVQSPSKPHTPGIVSKSYWQGENCTDDDRGLPRVENNPSYSHGNENLLLNSTVNSYNSFLREYNKEAQGSTNDIGSHPQGIGFPAAPLPTSLSFRQEQQMREGQQEKVHDHAILPLTTWPPPPGHAMVPQSTSTRPGASGQASGSQVRNMNMTNYSGPSSPHPTSLEGRRFGRYYPYPLPQYPPPTMQNNDPQGGFILGPTQQYPLVNSSQNNVSDQYNRVNSKAARGDNTH